jgi:hypothetical protein
MMSYICPVNLDCITNNYICAPLTSEIDKTYFSSEWREQQYVQYRRERFSFS